MSSSPADTAFTIPRRVDGFGHQYLTVMNAIAYAYHADREYRHRPFRRMEHDVDPVAMDTFIGVANFFSLATKDTEIVDAEKISKLRCTEPKPHVHDEICIGSIQAYFTDPVIEILRKCYWSTPKSDESPHDIIIHIRRGDVSPASPPDRYVPNEWYVGAIDQFKQRYPGASIAVFSQGEETDFREIVDAHPDTRMVLDGDARIAHYHMVTAKALLISESDFPRTAGILSKGQIYYRPPLVQQKRVLRNWIALRR